MGVVGRIDFARWVKGVSFFCDQDLEMEGNPKKLRLYFSAPDHVGGIDGLARWLFSISSDWVTGGLRIHRGVSNSQVVITIINEGKDTKSSN